MKRIFLAGSFREPEDRKQLERIYHLLCREGYEVWWAPERVQSCYGSNDRDLLKRINEEEENAIMHSDLLVAVMRKAGFGTAMEIKQAFDYDLPVIAYLLAEHSDFSSGAFKYRVSEIVKTDEELLKTLKSYLSE